jgi:hypothetical protein
VRTEPDLSDAAGRAISSVAERAAPGGTVPASARVVLHFHPDADVRGEPVLRRIVERGRYLPQFATQTGNGGLTAFPGGDRWGWEHRIFSGAYDFSAPEERPVYGALRLDGDPYGAAPRFGSAYLRLKLEVVGRSTFAFPDSVYEPETFGVADRFGLLEPLASADMDDPLDRYVEVQVHGGVRVPDDVEAVVVDPSFEDPEVLELAERHGVRVERHPGYRATVGEIEAHRHYRGQDVAAMAAVVAGGETLTPASIGRARAAGVLDPHHLKQLWHCLARYGRAWS